MIKIIKSLGKHKENRLCLEVKVKVLIIFSAKNHKGIKNTINIMTIQKVIQRNIYNLLYNELNLYIYIFFLIHFLVYLILV